VISGKLALGGLSLEFGNAKERFHELTSQLDKLTEREETLLGQEERVFEALARTYLPELSEGAVGAGLAELKEDMATALAVQSEHRGQLADRIGELPEVVSRHERLLAEAERGEEMAAQGVERVQDAVESELGEDPEHVAAVAEHRALMERRSVLAARRMRLNTTAGVERRRYDEDRAFGYLHSRDFGGPEYDPGFATRRLDGWLARRINYDQLLHNYRILEEGPKVVHLELRDLTDRAREIETRIDVQESGVGDRLGLSAALNASASAQEQLREERVALTEARERYDRLASEIRAVDANRGRPYEDALETHRDFLASRSIKELIELARSTPDPKDDGLVARLEKIRTDLAEVGQELRPLREQLEAMNTRTTNLGDLLRRASEHFSSRRSYFSEEVNMARLVGSVAEGTTDPDDAFARLESSHVKQPLLVTKGVSDFAGWFADLSANFDRELGAVQVRHESDTDVESEVVVYDNHGRVLHRRVTRRGSDGRRAVDRD